MEIDPSSSEPLHEQVAAAVRRAIADGEVLSGERLPPARDLAAVLGVNARLAKTFARAWNERVSPGALLYTGSPEGTGIMAAQRGDDPFDVTTQIRTLWR